MGKYYVIYRSRQVITLDYVKDCLENGGFPCFDTYEEASAYEKLACFDDGTHGVFLRVEDEKFLRISGCL